MMRGRYDKGMIRRMGKNDKESLPGEDQDPNDVPCVADKTGTVWASMILLSAVTGVR